MGNKIIETMGAAELFGKFGGHEEPVEVFGKFLYEGELGILFGDSNAGKSILANDIAFFVSGGGHEWGDDFVSPGLPAMYIDMEMEARQWVQRYRNAAGCITDGFRRAEVKTAAVKSGDIMAAVKAQVIYQQGMKNAPKFIIVDNITNGFGSVTNANRMRDVIFEFKNLKERFGLTILLVAHCPKRKSSKELTADNLGGSKMIMNFVDSAFAIGQSGCADNARYIKQIKSRACERLDNVLVCEITDEPYLSMQPVRWCSEYDAMNDELAISELTPEKEIELVRMLTDNPDTYLKDVAEKLGIAYKAVLRYSIGGMYV